MKQTIKKIVTFALATVALLASSCAETRVASDKESLPSAVEYTATLTLILSDAFFDSSIGTISAKCTDQNGNIETKIATSSPFSVSITDLEKEDNFSFNVDFELASGYTKPTESQKFTYSYSVVIIGNDGSSLNSASSSGSMTVGPDDVEDYVGRFTVSCNKTI